MALKNTWFNRSFRGKALQAEEDIGRATEQAKSEIAGLPDYQIPQQYQEIADIGAEAAGQTRELAGEATDIARARTGVSEMPGEAIARKQIQQSTAGTVQNIMQAGGGGASALGAIAQAGLGEQSAFGQLAMQRGQYKSQAEQDLANALRTEAGLTGQAAQLEQAGLAQLGQQEQQQFEYGREKDLTGLQFDIEQLGAMKQEEAARRQRNQQMWGSVIGAVGGIGGAMMGNPMALANVGQNIGGLFGGGQQQSTMNVAAPNSPSYYNQTKGV